MKSYLLAIISAALSGWLFSLYLAYNPSEDIMDIAVFDENIKVKIVELGSFDTYDEAFSLYTILEYVSIISDDDKYTVYGAVYSSDDLMNDYTSYLSALNIDYIIKDKIVSSYFYDDLIAYERLMLSSNDSLVVLKTNKIILDKLAIL